jgi:hypothetical protein
MDGSLKMGNYLDKWGRVHHKPCIDGEPSSNNGWLYTAYAAKLGILVSNIQLSLCMSKCRIPGNPPHLIRSPNKELPPMSRDEILGLSHLGLLQPEDLDNWNYSPYPIPKFNLVKLVQQLWDLRPSLKRHRNYFWQNNLDQMFRFAFSVPLTDRHFLLKNWGRFNIVYWLIHKIDGLGQTDNGIGWLKHGTHIENMRKEFPADHPLQTTKE